MQKETPDRYIDLLTDYGFKRVFGTEVNKDLLIDFLNQLFRGRKVIKDLTYNKNEHVGDTTETGSVIFDLTCTADNDEQFIIEVQRTMHSNLKRRMLYYGSKLIADQAPKGNRQNWNYNISEVYVIVLMDGFTLPEGDSSPGNYLHDICLCNRETGEVFYEDLGFIYVSLANFVKKDDDLQNDLERWLYVFFEKLFNLAAYSKLNREEKDMYDVSLKRKWDAELLRQTAIDERERALREGREEGREEERAKAKATDYLRAKKMLASGFAIPIISDLLGLSIEEIEALKREE